MTRQFRIVSRLARAGLRRRRYNSGMSDKRGFDRAMHAKRIDDILGRLAANSDSMAAIRGRAGVVPVNQWDEYDRLWEEMKAIKRDLYAPH